MRAERFAAANVRGAKIRFLGKNGTFEGMG